MLTTALVMAGLTFAAWAILFWKLPIQIRAWLSRRGILLDFVLSALVISTLGFAVTGIIAAAAIDLGVALYLWWYKHNRYKQEQGEIQRLKSQGRIGLYHLLVRICAKIYLFFCRKGANAA